MAQSSEQVEQLAKAASEGDRTAFDALYDELAPDIYRFVFVMMGDRSAVEDVVSETFIRLWRSMDRYKGGNIRSYTFTIARNCTIDVFRKRKHEAGSIKDEHAIAGNERSPLEHAIQSESEKRLYTALLQLSSRDKEVLSLRFFESMSIKEVAGLLGRTETSVKITQYRALRKMRKLLEAYEK